MRINLRVLVLPLGGALVFSACSTGPSADGDRADAAADSPDGADSPDSASDGAGGTVADGDGSSDAADAAGSGGSGAGAAACQLDCGSYKWACWPMPTPASTNGAVTTSYTVLDDQTVRDDVTCLTWQRAPAAEKLNWADSLAYCENLGEGWRLPSRIELTSIVDHAKNPAVDAAAFPGVTADGYYYTYSGWIVSNVEGKPQYTWIFGLNNGFTSNAGARDGLNRALCVKGGTTGEEPTEAAFALDAHYTPTDDLVTDNYTGLVWQRGSSPSKLSRQDALDYCEALELAGHDDFRLPALQELASLVDEALVGPAIDRDAFPNTPSHNGGTINPATKEILTEDKDWFWGSNPQGSSETLGWGLNFLDGFTGPQTITDKLNSGQTGLRWNYWTTGWAKCVR